MAAADPESLLTLRARVAGLHRRNADPERIDAARRDLAWTGLTEHARQVAATAPAPTPEQLSELRGLLPAPTRHNDE